MRLFLILILLNVGVAGAYEPPDAYELDEIEIFWYITELKESPKKNKEEIEKFELILEHNIQDEEEYEAFIKKQNEDISQSDSGVVEYGPKRPGANMEAEK